MKHSGTLSDQELAVLAGTIRVYGAKGISFTMDDIAAELKMSKKTIYKIFPGKEALFLTMVDYIFDEIKEAKLEVFHDASLNTMEKLAKIMKVMPAGYEGINFELLHSLKEKYPIVYSRVEERLESNWEPTILLIEQGQREGIIREVSIPIVKVMMETSLETFFQKDILVRNGLNYTEALDEVVQIILTGICAEPAT